MRDAAAKTSGDRCWRRVAQRFGRALAAFAQSKTALVGAALVVFWVGVALAAPWLAPFDPNATIEPLMSPASRASSGAGLFWLGTDHIGRDLLSRIIWGARRVLLYGSLATGCAYGAGITLGALAGFLGGLIDDALSFLSNVILSFPVMVLYVVVISTYGASGANIVVAVTFASAPSIMRVVRGLTLELRHREYVLAAQTRGEPLWRVLAIELLPNARGPLIVDACLRLGYTTITIGVLGFLGLGLPPPDPDWGGMIAETRQMAVAFPYLAMAPTLAITSLVLGFNLLADGLRDLAQAR